MSFPEDGFCLPDNGGRRTGIERRYFNYSAHIPERRSGEDRRSRNDRRSGVDRRKANASVVGIERRDGKDRRAFSGW
jgi:hypothetical protein